MRAQKILGIAILVAGIVLLGFSFYIKQQVAEGEEKISTAQRRVNQGNALFSLTPATKAIGERMTSSAQRKINEGVFEVGRYKDLAEWFQVGGIVFIILGAGIIFLDKKK